MLQGRLESQSLRCHQLDPLDLDPGEPEAGGKILIRLKQLKEPSPILNVAPIY